MKIGVIGCGVVGNAIINTFSKSSSIIKYDKFNNYSPFKELIHCDFVFISVPTPFDCSVNKVDETAILESLQKLEELNFKNIVVIKSTIPSGSCDFYYDKYNLDIVFNPEFLRESTSPNEDFESQKIVVIGTSNKDSFISVKNMYKQVLLPEANYYHTTNKEAETIKLSQNAMLASRVALANMIFDACQKNNVDYDIVRELAFDSFEILGPHMTRVPGPDGNRGFGGKCLPKDIRAFSTIYKSSLLDEIISYNDTLRDDLDSFLMNYK